MHCVVLYLLKYSDKQIFNPLVHKCYDDFMMTFQRPALTVTKLLYLMLKLGNI